MSITVLTKPTHRAEQAAVEERMGEENTALTRVG